MESSSPMKLVFQMSGAGFSLSLGNLVEIREFSPEEFDTTCADSRKDVLGGLVIADREIPVFDFAAVLNLGATTLYNQGVFLVLRGEMGEWALLVDEVKGIFPCGEFAAQTVSGLVSNPLSSPYEYVDVWRDEVLVQCDVERLQSCKGHSL